MATAETLHFKTHAELKNVIGQDLINDDNIAIIELVKNGLDAGAKKITVTFGEPQSEQERIIVRDDGKGMSRVDIVDKWLNIAYSEKKNFKSSKKMLAGNKGVGRFACDRLGKTLDMYTRVKGAAKILHLSVDWTRFEGKRNSSDEIQKIEVQLSELTELQYEKLTQLEPLSVGTRLCITDLRELWDRDKLVGLKRNLERFADPHALFDGSGTEIKLIAKHLAKEDKKLDTHLAVNGLIQNQIFEKLKFKTTYITSQVSADGEEITTALEHDGQQIYQVKERNNDFKLLPKTTVTIHYMNPYKKAYFKRQTGLNAVDFGSIFLFLNGFRIPPYGDRDNDWLKLDNRKGQGQNRYLGNRELLGRVVITDDKDHFRVVSNREGVTRSPAFSQLTLQPNGFFHSTLKRLERFVVSGIDWDSVSEETQRNLIAGKIPGDGKTPLVELYRESKDSKMRRIALNLLKLIGASPESTLTLEIDPEVLQALSAEKEEEVQAILRRFEDYGGAIDKSVQLALGRIAREFDHQKVALAETRKVVARKERQLEKVKAFARESVEASKELKKQVKTQETELHFSRLAKGTDHEALMLLHHQASIYANTVKNYLDRALKALRSREVSKAEEFLEKAMLGTRRILATSSIATKANFKLRTDAITSDVSSFIKEYVLNVAKDGAAHSLKVSVDMAVDNSFKIRFKPIDIAIVFDNLASNSTRSGAKIFQVRLSQPSANELNIFVQDDGPGLSAEISPPDAIFRAGVTTTNGSGLGLYHVRQTIEQMGGKISVNPLAVSGFGIIIRLFK